MSPLRAALGVAAVVVALVLQVSVFSKVAWEGIVPNLCLLVVVSAALGRGPRFGMLLGFAGGLALDLAPPADHLAGRWALALVLVGYVAGRVRQDSAPSPLAVLATVAVSSLLGTSVFALGGLLVGDLDVGIPGLLQVLAISLVWDLLLTPFVLPLGLRIFTVPDVTRDDLRVGVGA